jgi:hypothetical protein
MKQIIKHLDGTVEIIDNRTLYDAQNQRIGYAKEDCTKHLYSVGIDQATQQNAALGIYSPERYEAIKSYISACRNEYLRCKALILAATSNDEADAVQFLAPPVPEGI